MSRISAGVVALLLGAGVLVASAAERHVTRSQAGAIAAAINLRHGDLPSTTQMPPLTPAEIQQGQRSAAALVRCYGGPSYRQVFADVSSPGFTAGTGAAATVVNSDTEIFPSATLAGEDLAAAGRPTGLACVLKQYRAVVSTDVPKDMVLTGRVSQIGRVVAGSGATFAIRLTFATQPRNASKANPKIVFRFDVFAFVDGQAEIALDIETHGAVPSAPTELRLAKLLSARAHTAIG